jgi:hypothetical protein
VKFAYLVPSSGLSGANLNDATQQGRLDSEGNRFALQARRLSLANVSGITTYEDIIIASEDMIPAITLSELYRQDTNPNNLKASLIRTIAPDAGTDEQGILAEFDFALKLSPVFQNTVYSGGISIGISNTTGFFDPASGNFIGQP